MRNLQRISLVFAMIFALVQPAFTAEVNDGQLAAAIRSADYPCEHVLAQQTSGDNNWTVQCNSGTYLVTLDANGQFSVVKTD